MGDARGRFGFAARGIAVGVIGLLLIQAAFLSEPDEAQGMVGALEVLAEEPFGQWLLVLSRSVSSLMLSIC